MLLCSPGGGTKVKGRGAFTLTSIPFDGLTALSRFDKLTTLSWPKGWPKGFVEGLSLDGEREIRGY